MGGFLGYSLIPQLHCGEEVQFPFAPVVCLDLQGAVMQRPRQMCCLMDQNWSRPQGKYDLSAGGNLHTLACALCDVIRDVSSRPVRHPGEVLESQATTESAHDLFYRVR